MIKLKETSRLGRKLKERTGSTTVGSPGDEPASSTDVGANGPPKVRQELARPWTTNRDVVEATGDDPRGEGIPTGPEPRAVAPPFFYCEGDTARVIRIDPLWSPKK